VLRALFPGILRHDCEAATEWVRPSPPARHDRANPELHRGCSLAAPQIIVGLGADGGDGGCCILETGLRLSRRILLSLILACDRTTG